MHFVDWQPNAVIDAGRTDLLNTATPTLDIARKVEASGYVRVAGLRGMLLEQVIGSSSRR
jgi:hypothetical protein